VYAIVKGRGSKIYLPSPTWANHMNIFRHAGLVPEMYDYYDAGLGTFNLEKMLSSIEKAEDGSLFLMHSCAHNPTGCDPSLEQWDAIREALQKKKHYTLFDNAYQVPPSLPLPLLLSSSLMGFLPGVCHR
jgi:aspartate/tyrosine/aromatic aminotransferase